MTECLDGTSPFSSTAEILSQLSKAPEPSLELSSRPPSRATDSVSSITDMGSKGKTPDSDTASQQDTFPEREPEAAQATAPTRVPDEASAAAEPTAASESAATSEPALALEAAASSEPATPLELATAPGPAALPSTAAKKANGFPGPLQLTASRSGQLNGHAHTKSGEPRLQRQGSSHNNPRPSRNNSHSSLAGAGSPGGAHRAQQPAWQSHPNGHLPHAPFPNHMGANGSMQTVMMPGPPPPGTFFPGAPYGQVFPHFIGDANVNSGMHPMLYAPGGIMMPQGAWPYTPGVGHMMLPAETYNGTQGTGAFHPNVQPGGNPSLQPQQQLPPIPPPQFYQPYHSARFPPHLAGANPSPMGAWHPAAVPEQPFPSNGSSGKLNAAAPQFRPEERANGNHPPPRQARMGVSAGQNGSSPAGGPHAGHRRRMSVESIPEQPDGSGHRRQPSASSSHAERARGHRRMATWQPDDFDADAKVADGDADIEGLREGGRHGHSRRGSWHDRGCHVLEEFKVAKQRTDKPDWTLKKVKGNVVDFCKDQTGSRFIQDALNTATADEVDEVLQEVRLQLGKLMEDVFGNYVVQKLLERGSEENRRTLADRICQKGNRAVVLSKQQYGCRVVQKALEVLDVEQQCRIMDQLKGSVLELVADQNGNHVIQKCIEKIKPSQRIEPLIQELLTGPANNTELVPGVVSLSMHTYGCRVVQRVLEHCDVEALKGRFMEEILKDVTPLADNQFSNYVIQHVLEKGTDEERARLIRDLGGSLLRLSVNKYASNVVEKCLINGAHAEQDLVITELLSDRVQAVELMKNEFGNYVYYRAFEKATNEDKKTMADLIAEQNQNIRKNNYGKNLIAKLNENFPHLMAQMPKSPQAARPAVQFPGRTRLHTRTVNVKRSSPTQSVAAARYDVPVSTRAAVAAALKPEAGGKPLGAPQQVSVTADGAAPPVNTPLPASAVANGAATQGQVTATAAKADEDTDEEFSEALASPAAGNSSSEEEAQAPAPDSGHQPAEAAVQEEVQDEASAAGGEEEAAESTVPAESVVTPALVSAES